MADKDNTAAVGALMLMAGGIIGAGLALLYAPQPGKKTRKQIGRYSRRVRNDAEEMIRDTAESVTDLVEDLGARTGDLIDRGGDVADEWRSHLIESIDRGQKSLDKQRKRLTQLWS